MSGNYGTPPAWRVEGIEIDKSGATKLELVLPWIPTLQANESGILVPTIPPAPTVPGYKSGPGRMKRLDAGGFGMSYDFEGFQLPEGGGGGPENALGETWSFSGSLYQRYIKTNPNWPTIKVKYGWDETKKEFPDEMPKTAQSRGLSNKNQQPKLNPYRGQTGYDDGTGILLRTYYVRSITQAIFDRFNKIVRIPWADLGAIPERNFKGGMPNVNPYGEVFQIQQPFELSGPGGWNEDTYGKAID